MEAAPAARIPERRRPAGQGRQAGELRHIKPKAIEQSGIRGIASRHGYEVKTQPRALYHLGDDVGEARDVAEKNPDVVRRLEELAERAREDLGDTLAKRVGKNVRPVGRD